FPLRLHRKSEERPEYSGEHRVPTQPEQGISSTKLHTEESWTVFGKALNSVKRRLVPIEPCSHQRAVDETIAHIVELGAQQCEHQQDAGRLGDLLGKWRGNRSCKQHCSLRTQYLGDYRVQRDPSVDESEERGVERQSDGRGNQPTPQKGSGKQPRCFA